MSDFRQRRDKFLNLKLWWDHGKGQIKLLRQQCTGNVTCDVARSIKNLETDIVLRTTTC